MRPHLEEIKLLEEYMLNRLPEETRKDVEIRLLWDKAWQENLAAQKLAYYAIRQKGRQELRLELNTIHARLFGS